MNNKPHLHRKEFRSLEDVWTRERLIDWYQEQNLPIVPVAAGGKDPLIKGWNKPGAYETHKEEWQKLIRQNGYNIGLLLGDGGLVDVDIDKDSIFARKVKIIINKYRYNLESGSGRKKLIFRHDPLITESYFCMNYGLELRYKAKNGNNFQSLIPDSVHPETKKTYEWLTYPPSFPSLHKADLKQLLDIFESAKNPTKADQLTNLILPFWGKKGRRDFLALYLSGFLVQEGWDKDSVILVISELSDFTNDEQKESRLRVITDTYEKYARGELIKGYEGLKDLLDEQTLSEIIKIVGKDETPWLVFSGKGKAIFLPGLLAEHLAQHELSININGSLHLYKKGVYKHISDEESREIISRHISSKYRKTSWVSDVLSQWKAETFTHQDKLNPPNHINLRNGLFDWVEGKFKKHDPAILSTIQLAANYNTNAKCPRFLEFLDEDLEPDSIPLTQEIMGYCLTDLTILQKAFILLGLGSNGKSTLLSVIETLVGHDNVSHIPLQEIEERFNSSQLYMKLINSFADLDQRSLKSTSIFKIIVGEDRLSAEAKFRDRFSFKPFCKLIFSCNQLPRTTDRSHAYYRRFVIIPFNRRFEGPEADPLLRSKLFEELDGILLWALKGLERLLDNGKFSETETTHKALEQYKEENSSTISFVKEACVINTQPRDLNIWVWRQTLSFAYNLYCQVNRLHPVSSRAFNRELREGFPNIRESVRETKTVWINISLNTEWEEIISKKMDEIPRSENVNRLKF